MRPISRRRFVSLSLVGVGAALWSGCGTILHPERRGQPAGPLDWKIVLLDGIGLLLFFVPGVIAFAVDFSNGTIYLPPDHHYGHRPPPGSQQYVTRRIPPDQLTAAKVQQVVSEHVGRDVELAPGSYTTEPLEDMNAFWPAQERLAVR